MTNSRLNANLRPLIAAFLFASFEQHPHNEKRTPSPYSNLAIRLSVDCFQPDNFYLRLGDAFRL